MDERAIAAIGSVAAMLLGLAGAAARKAWRWFDARDRWYQEREDVLRRREHLSEDEMNRLGEGSDEYGRERRKLDEEWRDLIRRGPMMALAFGIGFLRCDGYTAHQGEAMSELRFVTLAVLGITYALGIGSLWAACRAWDMLARRVGW